MQVFKFGGASVKDADAVKNVAAILKKQANQSTIVVISAMGKTTNKLEQLVNAYFYKEGDIPTILNELKIFHLSILNQLIPTKNHTIYDDIENVFVELLWAIEEETSGSYNYHYDQLVSQGEVLATKIVSAYLNEIDIKNKWLDVRGFIQTDNSYREGKVDYELSQYLVKTELLPIFNSHNIIITQGFIGGTSENFTTTLGREGSDYTAALLAFFTDAKQVIIWKDVPGVLNADPKYFKNAKKIDELNYHDAIELTYYGASVIHPKTIKPLQNKNIPLFVKSFINPQEPGTVIKDSEQRSNATSYIFKVDQILLSIQPKDFSFIAEENLSNIFTIFSKYNVHVNMMQNSAISFSVCTDYDEHKIEPLLIDLQVEFKVLYNKNVELMTVRNYDQDIITNLTENKLVIIEQRSRNTLQMVMKEEKD
ncbi:MAG: aspartate kinase [Bacteroidota bacterium]|nr:aspartate kinase [Bacteroidota bacterium]MDP3144868.1 aspartate kinase [Bacteroidota bacterium]